jgi:hypothetical protein
VWFGLVCLVGLGIAARSLWTRSAPSIARHPQYQLSAESVHITPPPTWIRSDVKAEVLRDMGLNPAMSILGDWDAIAQRIKDAFEFHPWVDSVVRIERRLPSTLVVELTYRRPIAAVESSDAEGVAFLPIDQDAVRLPERDLTEAERQYLPRISGISGRPPVGDRWDDSRVIVGAKLAVALADVWHDLGLIEIVSIAPLDSPDAVASYSFEIVTSGGTRILWGAGPGYEASAGESPLDQKRERLRSYSAQHGRLDSIDGPAVLDLRNEVIATPRTARRDSNDTPPNAK